MPPVYKHVAPLGLKTRFLAFPHKGYGTRSVPTTLSPLVFWSSGSMFFAPLRCVTPSKIRPIKNIGQPFTPPMQKILIHGLRVAR